MLLNRRPYGKDCITAQRVEKRTAKRMSAWTAVDARGERVAQYDVERAPMRAATLHGGVRVPVGLTVFKTVARSLERSRVGSTPIRLCQRISNPDRCCVTKGQLT